ncbi:helix-turn-helix transcriptional regulator [Nocardioides panaciterrulae]|uniref:Uncharacterized protein n=1 Tax=Nocardioides panaciterrulae TaxID=661492 RepID=A0A7Y9JBV7_9ACTN|nr:helix-turn-helix transcriptional regulator [Nocardioides panaciterrulae]NYD43222.1 hypothetical protein [Nocardioides panaciterrulae]
MATPTKGGNPVSTRAGIDTRNRIVELVAANVENGGDGMTRAELAAELGITKPRLHKHLTMLFADRRVQQIGMKVVPSNEGHIHICRTCGQTMH